MKLTDPDNIFKLLSVIELHLPTQHTIIPPRPHSMLTFRLQGNATLHYQDWDIHLGTNDILFIPEGCAYYIDSNPEVVLCINFSVSNASSLQPEFFSPQNAPVFREAFQSIYNIWCMKKPGFYHKSMSLLYTILGQLDKQCSQPYLSPAFKSIKQAVNHMHANFTDAELSISSLCEIANLSDTQFRRNFHEVYGVTPLKYLQSLRVNYASDLLSSSSLSIEDISTMAGFSDSKYFCSVFKKHKHVPPSTYRKAL